MAAVGRIGPSLSAELRILEDRPWVGRTDLLATLVETAVASDRPRLVVISGEPGAGKSRLVARFAQEAANRGHLVMYGEPHAIPTPAMARS